MLSGLRNVHRLLWVLSRKALGLLMKSIENIQQARTQAIRARQRFEDSPPVSSRHRERVRSRQRVDNESITRTTRELVINTAGKPIMNAG